MHPMLSGYYSVHLRLSTHCSKLYPYQSSRLTHQDNPAKTGWHMVGGCNSCTPHASILSIPPQALVGYSILSILIFKYREIYLHMCPNFPTPTSIVVPASQGPVWHWLTVGICIPRGVLSRRASWASYLNGHGVNGFTHGCPSPLTLIQHLIMAWAIAHQPSWMVRGSVAR